MAKKEKKQFKGNPRFVCDVCGDLLQVDYPAATDYCTINPHTGAPGDLEQEETQGPEIHCSFNSKHDCVRHLTKEERNRMIELADRKT